MATMIIPSQAYGAPRRARGPGLLAVISNWFRAARAREAEASVQDYAGGRWCDATERELNEKLLFGPNRSIY